MADSNNKEIVKDLLMVPIQLADQICKISDEAYNFKQECQELKGKTEKLVALLRQAARARNGLYERPTRRIIEDTEQVLDKAFGLVLKCRGNGLLKRVFTIIPAAAFRKTAMQLENSIGDVSWLLRVSSPTEERDDEYLGMPPIAQTEPILCLIWEHVAVLHTGNVEERGDAAASLVSLARDNVRNIKLIIEEGGIPPLLKLIKEGKLDGQENAARAIGLLGYDPESVEHIVNCGVSAVFAKVLKEGHMKVQLVVAWAISEFAQNYPKCQEHFIQNNAIRYLVSHLAFETIQEHSKYTIASKQNKFSIHSVVVASNSNQSQNDGHEDEQNLRRLIPHPTGYQTSSQIHNAVVNTISKKGQIPENFKAPLPQAQVKHHQADHAKGNNHQNQYPSLYGTSLKGREYEDPDTKAEMKAMAAKALWKLCVGNVTICRNITESRALLCLAVLLEKGPQDVQSYSAKALMEITAVAEQYPELRRSAFKPTSPAAKAVVDQLLKVIEKEDPELLEPCIQSIGNLARTFRATETRLIGPLVKLLDDRDVGVTKEAATALNKFVCKENFLGKTHSTAIVNAEGVKHLIQHLYMGEDNKVKVTILALLCNIALQIPQNKTLDQEEVLNVLEWATKQQIWSDDPLTEMLLPEAKSKLELYQARGSRGIY